MGYIRKNGKVVGYTASPDDTPDNNDSDQQNIEKVQCNISSEETTSENESFFSGYFTREDRMKFPQRGHIPGSLRDGKVVTNPGLRNTGWQPDDE